MNQLVERSSRDPPMLDFQRGILVSLRGVFGFPYLVFKVGDNVVNDTGLSWNPDFWVEKNGKKVLVIGVLAPDTTKENLDSRMKQAFAIMTSNWFYRDKIALSANRSVLVLPNNVAKELSEVRYQKYQSMFENVRCELIAQSDLVQLELYRDDEDRIRNPIRWARPKA